MNRRRLLQIAACAALAPGAARAETWQGTALGAHARITLSGPADWRARAFAMIRAQVARTEELFSLHRADSALARLNATGALTVPPPEMAQILAQAARLHAATQGQFDPTVQPLWRALANGQDSAAARALVGWHRVRHGAQAIALAPGQALTLNGIAQGWATDRVADGLRALGAEHVLVNMGELRALDGPFRIGLPGGTATLTDSAIATSEPGALRLGAQGHILSPTGRAPLWSAVTVQATRATLADGLSTAAIFLSAPDLRAARTALPGIHRIWLTDINGDTHRI